MSKSFAVVVFALMGSAAFSGADAQTHARTDVIVYHDNTAKWVLGQVASSTNTNTGLVEYATTYDATTALPSQKYAFGKLQQTLTYNANGTVATVKDGNNNVTTLSNWKRGIPQTIQHPATPEATAGAIQSAVVDNNGWITSVTDETSSKTCYEYDPMGRVSKIIYPSDTQAGICDTSKWAETTIAFTQGHPATYGLPAGHWRQTTLTGTGRKIRFFDALWRPVAEQFLDLTDVDNTLSATFRRYDVSGRQSFLSYPVRLHGTTPYSDPSLKGVYTSYDALDRVTSVKQDWEGTPQLTTSTSYLSNSAGSYTLVTDPRGGQTRTWYQAFDRPSYDHPLTIWHPAGAYTHIDRDVFGKPKQLRRSNNSSATGGTIAVSRSYTYNTAQELCRAVEPETGATLMGYDGAGNLTWSASGLPAATTCHATGNLAVINARKATRTYDARNRLSNLSFPDGRGNQAWTYTPDGLPASITTPYDSGTREVVNSYTYNRRRLLTSELQALTSWGGYYVNNVYNANGHLARQTYRPEFNVPDIDYAPNALGQPTKAGTFATGVSYYPNGAVKQFTYGNGIVHTLTQNARGLPDTSCDFYGTCNTGAVLNDGYDYDQNGNVAAISDGRTGNRGNRTMTYDALDRLTATTSPMFGTATYAYDVLDNLTRVKLTGGNQVRDHYYCYDENATWRLTNVKTGSCTAGATVVGLGYDVQGNLSNKSGQAYTFDFGNRLRAAPGKEDGYAYDGHGRRVISMRHANGSGALRSIYALDGRLLFQQDQGLGVRKNFVYLGSNLIAERSLPNTGAATPVAVKYQHTDALGSPVAVTNEARTVLERTEYEPYGKPSNRAAQTGVGYTGHVEDAATSLTYMQQRYYDPQIGLFLSVDPVTAYEGGDWRHFNRYAYAYNNPYKFTDPDGRCPVCPPIVFFVLAMTHSGDANAPAPGQVTKGGTAGDALAAIPGARILAPIKTAVNANAHISQRAASREAKREVGIPTSQQASSQTNGRAPNGTAVGRQQSYEVSKPGGGTETKSVQVSRDIRGDHAGMTQIEAGTVKPGGQKDVAGRPRIQNEDKIRIDFDPGR